MNRSQNGRSATRLAGARRLESLGGAAVLVVAVLTVCVFTVGVHNLAGAVILLVMGLGVAGVYFAAHRHSRSGSARRALRWLALLWASFGLLLFETLIGLIGFGFFLLPLTLVALVTAFFGIIVQIQLALRGGRRAPEP